MRCFNSWSDDEYDFGARLDLFALSRTITGIDFVHQGPFADARRYRQRMGVSGSYFSRHRWSCNFRSVAVKTQLVVLRIVQNAWYVCGTQKQLSKKEERLSDCQSASFGNPDIILVFTGRFVNQRSIDEVVFWMLETFKIPNPNKRNRMLKTTLVDQASSKCSYLLLRSSSKDGIMFFQALLWRRRLLWNLIGEEANFLPSITTCLESKAIRQTACC